MPAPQKLIFDIGMHTGQDTRHYLKKGYKTIAIEANPMFAELGALKFEKAIKAGQLIILNIGISDKEGILPFYINKQTSEWSSFDREHGTRNNTPYEIKNISCITTKSLFEKYGIPFYLKVDIEGYDFYCINDLPDSGDKPQYVSCEANTVALLDTLHSKGYTKFKLIHQGNNFKPMDLKQEAAAYFPIYQEIRNGIMLRLQKVIHFEHPYSSSGPFAEETKGEWLSYAAAREMFLAFYQHELMKPLNGKSWFDFHATF